MSIKGFTIYIQESKTARVNKQFRNVRLNSLSYVITKPNDTLEQFGDASLFCAKTIVTV